MKMIIVWKIRREFQKIISSPFIKNILQCIQRELNNFVYLVSMDIYGSPRFGSSDIMFINSLYTTICYIQKIIQATIANTL